MHVGKLDNDTAAGRLYRILRAHPGEWMGGWELSQAAATDCLSTRISEVRRQLPRHLVMEHEERRIDGKRRQFYRVTCVALRLGPHVTYCDSCTRFKRHRADWSWSGGQPEETECRYLETAEGKDAEEAQFIFEHNGVMDAAACPGFRCVDDRGREE